VHDKAGNTNYTIFKIHGCHLNSGDGHMSYCGWPWEGTCHAMGGHRSLLMVMVWVLVQI